ncbi:MAG: glycoside hydrolase family 3 C-terminal domain-containing protein [Bacteroidales bacterium]|nr:glycoside hydrolase family 3 C-terminal domain-containing protein [Bacteroidales bacterium]
MKRIILFLSLSAIALSLSAAPVITKERKERAASIVSKMTVEEKIDLISGKIDGFKTHGIPRLGIPCIRMADGPQGVRNVDGKNIQSTFFPCGISAAASWNREAVRGMGAGIGSAAKAHGVQIMLGPGVNIYRSALCGRNFEYFGEDPFLAAETALNYIEGMQDEGVMATIKHFALNQQEYDRHGVSSNADERTINELYFPTFRKAVEKGNVAAVMTSYNLVNGTHAAENPWLVKENLRKWGFDGIVMSDWISSYSTVNFMTGGVDLEMPRSYVSNQKAVKALLENGVVTEADLNEKCQNILQSFIAYGFLDNSLEADPSAEDPAVSRRRAYDIAIEGPVLLKNEGNLLPLKPGKDVIAVIGPNANIIPCGGGSGWVNPEDGKAVTLAEGLLRLGKKWNVQLMGTPQPDILKKAAAVIVCIGFDNLSETEGKDRKYTLPKGQDELVENVASYNKNVIVVVNSGGEFSLTRWEGKVKAIIMDWYPGQEGGNALADIVSGKVSPSGKLPFTFWGECEKNPAQKWYEAAPLHPRASRDRYPFTTYGEGIFLGYRGVEHFGVQPLYPFGFGLSYGSFDYSDLSVIPAGDGFDVSFSVRNSGKADAKEVAEVYVAPKNPSLMRPAKELKGYDKKLIAKGKSVRYTIHLDADAFKVYDTAIHAWRTDPGKYEIQIGSSSADIRLSASVEVR